MGNISKSDRRRRPHRRMTYGEREMSHRSATTMMKAMMPKCMPLTARTWAMPSRPKSSRVASSMPRVVPKMSAGMMPELLWACSMS